MVGMRGAAKAFYSCGDRALKKNMKARLKKAVYQGKKYLRILDWLLREAYFKQFWGRPAGILFFGASRLICQAAAVAVLYFYANALKSASVISFLSFNLAARESALLMWFIIISAFLFLALSSLFQFFSRTYSISLASAYEEDSSRHAFSVLSRLPDTRTPQVNELLKEGVLRKIPGDARRAGMTVRIIGYTVPQAISGVVALFSIMIIDATLTLILAGLTVGVFLGQYPANLRGARHSETFEKDLRDANIGIAELIRSFLATPQNTKATANKVDEFFSHQGLRSAIQSFGGRLRVIEESTLITQVGSALIISLAVFIIGSRLLKEGANWGLLLTYIASLRIALGGVVQIGRALTSMSRFYPQLVRYHMVLTAQKKLDRVSSPLLIGERLLLGPDGSDTQMELKAPQRVALFTDDRIDRRLFHLFNYARVRDGWGSDRPFNDAPRIVAEIEEIYKRDVGKKDAQLGAAEVLFVEADVLAAKPLLFRETLFDRAIAIIVYTDLHQAPKFGESWALFWLDCKIQGVVDLEKGDFASAVRAFEHLFAHTKRAETAESLDAEEQDDEF